MPLKISLVRIFKVLLKAMHYLSYPNTPGRN